jgi:hypothetical protein
VSKDDVEIPPSPPRKRRVLEDQGVTLDKWLAVWANDESLPVSQRARAQRERDRRKLLLNLEPDIVGVLVGREGATPEQLDAIRGIVHGPSVLEVHAPAPLKLGLEEGFVLHRKPDLRERLHAIVKSSTTVVAAPKEAEKPNVVQGVWEAVRYARHRGLPVTVVMPDGEER